MQDVAPPVEKVLAGQVEHEVQPVPEENVPAGHRPQVPPLWELAKPAAQGLHELDPEALEEPAEHKLQEDHPEPE